MHDIAPKLKLLRDLLLLAFLGTENKNWG